MTGVKVCYILFYAPPAALLQGSLYSDFKVVGEICRDLFRSLQCSQQPWSRLFLSTAIDHLIKDASGGGTTSEREPGPVPCEDMLREDGQTISLISFILVPMPPNCHHAKGWLQPFNPPWNWWLSQHLPSFCIPWCQPWRFNGPFWNSVWLLVWFPSAATIKWLAGTFQPTIKLVIEPTSAILLHSLLPALAFQWAILE